MTAGSVKKFVSLEEMTLFGKNYDMKILIEKEYFYAGSYEQIRQIIADNNYPSVADVYSLLRGQF